MESGVPQAKSLSLTQNLLEEIIEHCRDGYPYEACGIVSGKRGRAEHVHPMANVAPDPKRRYLLDPREQIAVFRDVQDAGQEVVAIFHSHPSTPAYPSDTDINLAFYPDAFYVIVSLAVEPPDVRAFWIDPGTRSVVSTSILIRSPHT